MTSPILFILLCKCWKSKRNHILRRCLGRSKGRVGVTEEKNAGNALLCTREVIIFMIKQLVCFSYLCCASQQGKKKILSKKKGASLRPIPYTAFCECANYVCVCCVKRA